MSEDTAPAAKPSEKAEFIKELIDPAAAKELLARRKKRPNDIEFIELAQAFNRKFYPALPTNYRGCAPEQITELEKLLK